MQLEMGDGGLLHSLSLTPEAGGGSELSGGLSQAGHLADDSCVRAQFHYQHYRVLFTL